jgi:hypothetical protein
MSFNVLIQLKLTFHKINSFFSSIDQLSSSIVEPNIKFCLNTKIFDLLCEISKIECLFEKEILNLPQCYGIQIEPTKPFLSIVRMAMI